MVLVVDARRRSLVDAMSAARCFPLHLKVDRINALSTHAVSRSTTHRLALPQWPSTIYASVSDVHIDRDESLVVDRQIVHVVGRRVNTRLESCMAAQLVKVVHGVVTSQLLPQQTRCVRKVT